MYVNKNAMSRDNMPIKNLSYTLCELVEYSQKWPSTHLNHQCDPNAIGSASIACKIKGGNLC